MVQGIAFIVPGEKHRAGEEFLGEGLGPNGHRRDGQCVDEYDLPGGNVANTIWAEVLVRAPKAGGSIGLEADDVDASVRTPHAKGVPIKVEPFSTSACRMAAILDPRGSAVGLHQVTKEW